MIDLNPPGSSASHIFGMIPGQQVGYATFEPFGVDHAAIWSGTAEGWVDLNPPNSTSQLYATCGSAQVGILNGGHAAIWFGTPGSVIDLHSLLPSVYYYSVAYSVYEQNGTFYVGGAAMQANHGSEAFLWVGTVPAPSSLVLLGGAGAILAWRRRGRC
jgi:hypothetical protein